MTCPATRLLVACLCVGVLLRALPSAAHAEGDPEAAAEAEALARAEALVKRLESREAEVQDLALAEAASEQHAKVTTALVKLLGDERLSVRDLAREALTQRDSPAGKKQAALGLVQRLARLGTPPQTAERLDAIKALGTLAQVVSIKALADGVKVDTPGDEVEARVMAIAEVPDAKAIEALIDLRAKSGNHSANEVNRSAALCRQALRAATGVDMGADTDAWRSWWKDNAETFDFAAAAAARDERGERRSARGRREDRPKPPK